MKLRFIPVVIALLCFTLHLSAQSLDKKATAALQSGINTGSVDSLIGAHYYYFWAKPGSFILTCGQGGVEGLGASGKAKCLSGLSPATPGAVITVKSLPNQDVYSGSVKIRTRVGIAVQPPDSPLVRSTVNYTLTASGNVTFGSAEAAGPPIVGMYNTMYNNPWVPSASTPMEPSKHPMARQEHGSFLIRPPPPTWSSSTANA